jgi:hypothetical protein
MIIMHRITENLVSMFFQHGRLGRKDLILTAGVLVVVMH